MSPWGNVIAPIAPRCAHAECIAYADGLVGTATQSFGTNGCKYSGNCVEKTYKSNTIKYLLCSGLKWRDTKKVYIHDFCYFLGENQSYQTNLPAKSTVSFIRFDLFWTTYLPTEHFEHWSLTYLLFFLDLLTYLHIFCSYREILTYFSKYLT